MVKLQDDMHPHCTRVLQAGCECPAGPSAICGHLARMLLTVHLLPRSLDSGIKVPVTSRA